MKWMKHHGKASLDARMTRVINEMGCFGVGLYWRLCEYIECQGNGSYPREQLINELKGRRLNSRHIHTLLDKFSLFVTLPNGFVTLSSEQLGTVFDEDEPMSRGTLVEDEPMSHGTSVEQPQRAHAIERDSKRENNNNNAHTHEWLESYKECKWYPYLVELLHSEQSLWREAVCMKSGYGLLLMRQWEHAVRLFALHLLTYDTGGQICSLQDARYYFNSYINPAIKSGRELKEELKRLDNPEQSQATAADPYRFEERINGKRYANGHPIPDSAPPRPSATAIWDESSESWIDFYTK